MALSTTCQSGAARGFRPASASSHDVSRSLMRAFAAGRSPLSARAFVSTTIDLNFERSPSLDGVAASAGATIGNPLIGWMPAPSRGTAKIVAVKTVTLSFLRIDMLRLLCNWPSAIAVAPSSNELNGWILTPSLSSGLRQDGIRSVAVLHADEGNQADDDGQETQTCVDGAKSQAAIVARLRQQIAKRRTKRARQDVGQPECQNGVRTEIICDRNRRDQRSTHEDAQVEAKAEGFCREVAGGRTQREGEKDGRPVNQLAAHCA